MSHPDDELLSALLDGEAPPGDAAHVDGCAACQERLDQLQFAADSVAKTIAIPPAHLREASLAVALRTADEPVRSLPTIRRLNSGLSAAAVLVVALAVGGLLITQLGRDTSNQNESRTSSLAAGLNSTTVDGNRKASAESAGGGAAADDAAAQDSTAALSAPAGSTMAAPATPDLGDVDDIAVVSKRSTTDLEGREASSADTFAAQALECPPDAADEPVIWHATLTYKGTPAVATVRTHSATTRVTEIRAREGCALLASQEFEPTSPR